MRIRLTKNAIQHTAAREAVMTKFLGDTSHDVSATMRPKAKHENMIANCNSQR
jgi:hypothetical protein